MKKIINNKVYDTVTATMVGRWANGGNWRDFSHTEEALYRKHTGEFFLHGEGGPMTHYARTISDNEWSGGEKIIPLTAAKAREWAEEHLSVDEYAVIFGLPDDDADAVRLAAQIPAQLMTKLRARAADEGTSLTACLIDILTKAL